MRLTLLHIRRSQLKREIIGLGLYVLAFIAIAAYLIFIAFRQFEKQQNGFYVIAAITFVCTILHYYRKDKAFVYKHIQNPHIQIFSEYAVLGLPFAISSIITKSWYFFPIMMLLLFCIPFFKFSGRQKTIFKNLSSIIPPSNFEWLGGFRKYYISFISLYILSLAFCWLRIFPLFLLWILTTLITSLYTECESIQVLREGDKKPEKYLTDKLRMSIVCIIVAYTPVVVINAVFNSEFLLISLLFIPMQIALVCFAVFLKYSSYKPNTDQQGNNIPLTIISLFSLLPYLLPVPAILSIIYFYKAKHNLNQYLND